MYPQVSLYCMGYQGLYHDRFSQVQSRCALGVKVCALSPILTYTPNLKVQFKKKYWWKY